MGVSASRGNPGEHVTTGASKKGGRLGMVLNTLLTLFLHPLAPAPTRKGGLNSLNEHYEKHNIKLLNIRMY